MSKPVRNDLIDLRHHLYRRYGRIVDRDLALADAILSRELSSTESVQLMLRSRRIRGNPEIRAIRDLLPMATHHMYVRRYLSDALVGLDDKDAARELVLESTLGDIVKRDILADADLEPFQTQAQADSNGLPPVDIDPLVFQSVFYGDPGNPGKGRSGGIGALVLRLGDALASGGDPAFTFATTSISDSTKNLHVQKIVDGHHLGRYSLDLEDQSPEVFLNRRPRIKKSFRQTLEILKIVPQSLHVRFLDDASLVLAREARSLGIPTAVTLTPDPHRSLVKGDGTIMKLTEPEQLITLHRIWVGDELSSICRGLMGIGREAIRGEVLDYFPQLEYLDGKVMASIDEGVPAGRIRISLDMTGILTRGFDGTGINPEMMDRPIMLSVGRLAAVKNMPALASAWASGFWKSHNLVIVGGDFENPGPEESDQIRQIRQNLETAPPEARGRWVHLPGQDPAFVRQLESWLAGKRSHRYPSLYVAASKKEEFGLAILEAMGAGLIACAPRNGGAGAYIRPHTNGFIIDTRSAPILGLELQDVLDSLENDYPRIQAIQEAAINTVQKGYSIERMAEEYRVFYNEVTTYGG